MWFPVKEEECCQIWIHFIQILPQCRLSAATAFYITLPSQIKHKAHPVDGTTSLPGADGCLTCDVALLQSCCQILETGLSSIYLIYMWMYKTQWCPRR